MLTITANELKNKGVSAMLGHDEVLVTVRGHPRYVMLEVGHYHHLRELELAAALEEAKRDYAKGDYMTEAVTKHIKRISKKD